MPFAHVFPILPKIGVFSCNYVNVINIFHWKFYHIKSLLFIYKSFHKKIITR